MNRFKKAYIDHKKSFGDAVDTLRMIATIRHFIEEKLSEEPKATLASVLNYLHWKIGDGNHDSMAERELMEQFSNVERDDWYQRIIENDFDVDRGQLMDSKFKDGEVIVNHPIVDFVKGLNKFQSINQFDDESDRFYEIFFETGASARSAKAKIEDRFGGVAINMNNRIIEATVPK